jgi:NADH dehydrogenase [ubiquinone] 1 alpha subcomplex assembly factor 7
MADMLRVSMVFFKPVVQFFDAEHMCRPQVATQIKASRGAIKEVHLVETSLTLRAIQESTLRPLADTLGCTLVWHDMIEDVPEDAGVFTALVAHEFFDALPFRLIEKTTEGWREVLIASAEQRSSLPPPIEPSTTASDALKAALQDAQTATPIPTPLSSVLGIESNPTPPPPSESPLPSSTGTMSPPLPQNASVPPEGQRFRYVLRPDALWEVDLLALTSPRFSKLPVGARAEISLESNKTARTIGRLLSPAIGGEQGEKQHVRRVDGGAALVVDYGDTKTFGDSFRVSFFCSHYKLNGDLISRFSNILRASKTMRLWTSFIDRANVILPQTWTLPT